MKRREFAGKLLVGAAATAAGATALGGCGEGPGARRRGEDRAVGGRVVWRLASSFPRSLDILFGASERFADRVAELTGGAFTIDVYQGGEIVPALEVLDAVGRGSVEIGQSASYYYIGRNPALAFDCTVPFGLTAREQNGWLYEGGGLALMREIFADFNVVNFPGGNTGVQMGGWFRRPIADLDDLAGRKMRIPGLGGRVMERLGVTAQVIPGGEVFTALERGSIDAAEWVGPHDDLKLGLDRAAANYYYPGWWEPGAMISFYVNRDAYEKLDGSYRAAIETAAAESNVRMLAAYDRMNATAFERILSSEIAVAPFPADIMSAARRAADEILREGASDDATYRRVYDSFRSYREASTSWFATAEMSFLRSREQADPKATGVVEELADTGGSDRAVSDR